MVTLGVFAGIARPNGVLTVTYRRQATVAEASETKVCPDCAEEVKAAARICRFCRHKFEQV
jgi:hypothetical protein